MQCAVTDSKDTDTGKDRAFEDRRKRPYTRPELVAYGPLTLFTQGSGVEGKADGGGGKKGKKPKK